jgi:hypothetical protein
MTGSAAVRWAYASSKYLHRSYVEVRRPLRFTLRTLATSRSIVREERPDAARGCRVIVGSLLWPIKSITTGMSLPDT